MAEYDHKRGFPDQPAITRFLRTLISDERTQVVLAQQADIAYNTLTNWFSEDPPNMSAVNLLRLVIAAGAEQELADWLRKESRANALVNRDTYPSDQRPAYKRVAERVKLDVHDVPPGRPGSKARKKGSR